MYWDMVCPWLAWNEAIAANDRGPWVTLGDLRLDVIARESGISPSTLRRHITSVHGGFRQVRRKILVDAGTQLLSSSSRSVESIAAQLGYSDARSFRRFIKAATGKTPDALRAEKPSARTQVLTPEIYDRTRDAALKRSA